MIWLSCWGRRERAAGVFDRAVASAGARPGVGRHRGQRVGVRPSNGHIGLRGNLDEGEPQGLPGTYLNSVYEPRPLPHGETPATAVPSQGRRSSTSPTAS